MTVTDDMTDTPDIADYEPEPDGDTGPMVAEPSTATAPVPAIPDPSTTVDIPLIPGRDEFVSLAMQAKLFASASIVPAALRNKPSDILLVLMTGRDLGITPTAALRKCYVVDGQVTVAPALKIALVRMKGLGAIRPPARYLPNTVDGDGNPVPDPDYPNNRERATAIALDANGHEIGRATLEWADVRDVTYDKAGRAKLVDKDNWKNYPHRMLWWRVATTVVDDFFPEVAFGIYDADALGAITGEDGEVIELDSVEVPAGFVRERGSAARPAADDPVADDVAAALKARASSLPDDGKEALRGMARGADVPLRFSNVTHRNATRIAGMLDTVEKRAARGEWGEWSPASETPPPVDDVPDNPDVPPAADDGVTDVCGDCGEAVDACTCASFGPDVMDDATLQMLLALPRDGLVNIGVPELRAACRGAHVAFDDDCDAEDLADLLLIGTAPFDDDGID